MSTSGSTSNSSSNSSSSDDSLAKELELELEALQQQEAASTSPSLPSTSAGQTPATATTSITPPAGSASIDQNVHKRPFQDADQVQLPLQPLSPSSAAPAAQATVTTTTTTTSAPPAKRIRRAIIRSNPQPSAAAHPSTQSQTAPTTAAATCPPHPSFWEGLCVRCGAAKPPDSDSNDVVSLKHLHTKHIEVTKQEADRIKQEHLGHLLAARKLTLVLDLDHTLLHSIKFSDVAPDTYALLIEALRVQADRQPRMLHHLPDKHLWTKLRPGVFHFLEAMHELFELHIYTMGDRLYAHQIASILDPTGRLFGGRVISQADSTSGMLKDLDVTLSSERHVLILDDTETVWPNFRLNLINVERYMYFPPNPRPAPQRTPALLDTQVDEVEGGGMLAACERVLAEVHRRFFDPLDARPLDERDARYCLAGIRGAVLEGCCSAFSRCWPQGVDPFQQPLWRLAEELGAEPLTEVRAGRTTHLVACGGGTQKFREALAAGAKVVLPEWLKCCFYRWKWVEERDFALEARPRWVRCPAFSATQPCDTLRAATKALQALRLYHQQQQQDAAAAAAAAAAAGLTDEQGGAMEEAGVPLS